MQTSQTTNDATFIERLRDRTLARSLAWSRTEHDGRYTVRLGDYVVEIGASAATTPEVMLSRADGRTLELYRADSRGGRVAEARRLAFEQTYAAARTIALTGARLD